MRLGSGRRMARSALPVLLALLLALVAGCGGGGGEAAVCEAQLEMDAALAEDIPDEERLLSAMEDADVASAQADDEFLGELASEAGVLAATARVAIEETGDFSDGLFDQMVLLTDDLGAECERLGL